MNEQAHNEAIKLAQIILTDFKPKQIYLFGSFAYGVPNKDSDLDLCVIMDTQGQRKIDIAKNIRKTIYGKTEMPVDLVVCGFEEFLDRKENKSTLEYIIANKGTVLYEQ